jgi:hypothetical protein
MNLHAEPRNADTTESGLHTPEVPSVISFTYSLEKRGTFTLGRGCALEAAGRRGAGLPALLSCVSGTGLVLLRLLRIPI